MKFSVVPWAAAAALSLASPSFAQEHAVNPPGTNAEPRTGIGSNSQTATGVAPSAAPEENNTDENDDRLYRGRTDESEVPMLRDDGRLHFKTRPKEKTQEVDSKNLKSSGTDPKFQGNLATSGVSSINKVAEKSADNRAAELAAEVAPENPVDPRFATKHRSFTPEKDDQPKKKAADSNPSPTPTPTPSPAKNSNNSKP